MATQANPWQTPYSAPSAEASEALSETVCWQGRRFTISARAKPSSWYLITEYTVTLDTGETFSSSQLRLRERFEFEFEHKGRMVPGRFQSVGLLINGESFRLGLDDEFESEGELTVEHWYKSQFTGVLLGMAIGGMALAFAYCYPHL